MTKTYVEWFLPGIMFSESIVEEVVDRQIPKQPREGCFACRFYDIEEVVFDGEKLTGCQKNKSGRYYYGKRYTIEEVGSLMGNESILYHNLNQADYVGGVYCVTQNWQPLTKDDEVIEVSTPKPERYTP